MTKHTVGDRVGVGCMVNSCGECVNCQAGEEQYCLAGNTGTYGAVDRDGTITQGGYSTHVVVTEDFVVTIPEGIELDVAAPLLCAGITTYSPLNHWGAGPGKKVAIVGLGGLGHMAVKIAHAMGAEVTVLSQSLKKQEDGLRLGADHYFATSDENTFTELAGTFDLIINTVSASIDISAYLQLLDPRRRAGQRRRARGTAPGERVLPDHGPPLLRRLRASAASAKPRKCSTSAPSTAWAPRSRSSRPTKINDAYERVLASDVRYRFVIDAATLN